MQNLPGGKRMKVLVFMAGALVAVTLARAQAGAATIVYRCPGNVYTSSSELTPAMAEQRGCRVIEGAPITIVQGTRVRPSGPAASPAQASAPRPEGQRVDPDTQRERDADARRILNEELRREESRLAELRREYNDGQPERRGDERNYQRYLDRVAELKAGIERKEADIAALKRELAKLPS
jgi:hypothetical protein